MVRKPSLFWGLAAVAASAALALLWSAPLLWALSTALRPEHETVSASLHWLPQTWTAAAFAKVLAAGSLPRWLFNSALVAVLVTILTMAISIAAAYAFSQLKFRGRGVLFAMTMLAFMLPFEALIVPLFRLMNQLRLVDTYAGVILPQLVSPMAIYVFKQFFDAVPSDFRDAAAIDGASHWQVLRHVYLPVSANIVWAMAIIAFIGAWNNFLWPFIIITSSDMMTIPLGLTQTQDAFGVRYAQAMAAALLGGLPVAVAYLVFQRRVTAGLLAATGLKG
ncbi:carbohydrate ABC transporter permease [Noviherbaspirillum aerium]|uniref:carbohydrate ABC transporter permease n=1 Tax=Noviherbaspirillum aerium TaxID=2588497 RepID=UPI00124D87FF|nr:carbohydrate ABC transporter permease [Noviherbaspirillum aerium]